jgi:formylglycine-generating enzyme required for sulfatase activity
MRGPDAVNAHPEGASLFAVMDMVGNVWQWTEQFQDDHTRGGILRGGSYYQPQGSIWYFPQAYKLYEHGKLLMMAPKHGSFRRRGLSVRSRRGVNPGSDNGRVGKSSPMQSSSARFGKPATLMVGDLI